ncbi:amino acid ABC transporter permease [Aliamphritea ceti]|uniref:amino acid ABC transporter permease n=1 Tax=Aliamphritea ceti TaxID=1524258 RepID=UPI0021C48346|nr:amino acid ABC transporter permease [Aliamphritea ceti]
MSWLYDLINVRLIAEYSGVFLDGIIATVWISLICLILSLFFGVFVALMRMSEKGIIWRTAAAYIQFIRSTPLLIQIYLIYYGLPNLIGNFFDETQTGIIALTIHTTPYMAEILRTGIMSVPRTQTEGAMAVGMNRFQTMYHVILPQAIAKVISPLLGQTVVLLKDTSLLSIIAVFELMGAGLLMFSDTVVATESYLTTAVCYLAIYMMLLIISGIVERKLGGTSAQLA